jgi:hypothetical protein
MINVSGPVTSCIFGYIFKVKNTTLGTTWVIFPYAAEILNVLVYAYMSTEPYSAFRTFFGKCMRATRVLRLRNSTMGIQHRLYFPCIPIVLVYNCAIKFQNRIPISFLSILATGCRPNII